MRPDGLSLLDHRRVLVLGGARSGKSRFAESLVEKSGLEAVYVATAEAGDGEMAQRIAVHRSQRGSFWHTIETTTELAQVIAREAAPKRVLLVDCLTLWLSNILFAEKDLLAECDRLVGALRAASGPVVAVSNEVGLGIVPDNALSRSFRDGQGRLNQMVAEAADTVVFIAAGCPLILKNKAAR
jgi:adenosylcobinamide kinase/adenosylcobinamide-phosphate guanylyltransferase